MKRNKKNSKLFKAMMMAAMAMMIMSAHRASAAESITHKCSNVKGSVHRTTVVPVLALNPKNTNVRVAK